MVSFFFPCLWGVTILLSFIGWGEVIKRALFAGYQIDWGQKASWGLAFSVVIGGILNIFAFISKATVLVYLLIGFLFWLHTIFKIKLWKNNSPYHFIKNHCKNKVVVISVLLVLILVFLQYGGWVFRSTFNMHDDFHAYFVFPHKMLQTGSLGPDPFSERRIVASLGGQSFLHTFILSVLSEQNLTIIDPGLGVLITIGLLLGYFKDKDIPRKAAMFILIFFLLIPQKGPNVTAVMVPLALFISLFRVLDCKDFQSNVFGSRIFVIALITASICSLKTSFIPVCGVLYVLNYFLFFIKSDHKKKVVCEFLISSGLVGVFLLPWMISMYQSSGTFLFPLFGRGYHGSAYGTFPSHTFGLTFTEVSNMLTDQMANPYVISFIALAIANLRSRSLKICNGYNVALAFTISAAFNAIFLFIITRGLYPRYSFASSYATIIILMMSILANSTLKAERRFKRYTYVFVVVSVACVIIGNRWPILKSRFNDHIEAIKFGCSSSNLSLQKDEFNTDPRCIPSDELRARYLRMQQSIPAGETVLTRLSYPFLLDFKRNTIFISDYSGGASPPPGMPFFKGAEPLSEYLISKSVRYVAYSYADEANFPKRFYLERLKHPSPWVAAQAKCTFDFQDNLRRLEKSKKKIYNDGRIFVLDLLGHREQ
ncbi:MAG: hypothetical protein JW804_05940 [Sedimentisphaerales bacterium]|nr:hypothetical protein [Sedimentisphaerales bacterium]